MHNKFKYGIFFILTLLFFSCEDDNSRIFLPNNVELSIWTSDIDDNFITGSFNPFPLVGANNTRIFNKEHVDYCETLTVAVVYVENEYFIFPFLDLETYEAINFNYGQTKIAVTHCPKTKTTITFNRNFHNSELLLRASGYLYRDNLVLYDENSGIYYSQILQKSITINSTETDMITLPTLIMEWKDAIAMFPSSRVVLASASSEKICIDYIDSYQNIEHIIPLGTFKKKYLGFNFSHFSNEGTINASKSIIIVGFNNNFILNSFISNPARNYTLVEDAAVNLPSIFQDDVGNIYNLLGVVEEGPQEGSQLQSANGFYALPSIVDDFFETVEYP